MSWRGARVLVTGASSGIGRAVAERLLRQGARVAGCARRVERLEAVSGLIPVVGDLSDVAVAEAVADRAAEALGGLDGVIHCAGVTLAGPHAGLDDAEVEQMYRLHVLGTDALVRQAIPHLVASDRGRLAIVSSAVALSPSAYNVAYAASKSFQLALADALRQELAHQGVRVTAVLCGIVNTEILDGGRGFPPALVRASRWVGLSPERAAKTLLRDVARGRARSMPGARFMRIPGAPAALSRLTRLARFSYGA